MPSIIHDIFVSACLSPYSVNSFIHNKEYDLAQITTDTLFFPPSLYPSCNPLNCDCDLYYNQYSYQCIETC